MPVLNLPDWMAIPESLEPKLLVLFVLIGTVLFLARRGRGTNDAKRRITAIMKSGQH